jgi:hypothetical protein
VTGNSVTDGHHPKQTRPNDTASSKAPSTNSADLQKVAAEPSPQVCFSPDEIKSYNHHTGKQTRLGSSPTERLLNTIHINTSSNDNRHFNANAQPTTMNAPLPDNVSEYSKSIIR